MRNTTFALTLTLLATTAAPALADSWSIDGKHSQASFKIRHMMVSNVNGTVTGIKGAAEYDGKNINSLKVDADLDAKTINTSEAARDEHLRGADFFNTDKFPTMKFKSTKAEQKSNGHFQLVGELTMHGVTKPVTMDVEGPTPVVKDDKGVEHIGATATAKINRKDFGIEYNKVLDNGGVALGETVDVSLDIELTKGEPVKKAAK